MRIVAVTGANGFVGQHIVDSLLASNSGWDVVRVIDVRVAKDAPLRSRKRLSSKIQLEFVVADICEEEQMHAALAGCLAVVHAAGLVETRSGWLHDERIFRVNTHGSECVTRACLSASVRRLVYMSSTSVLADGIWGDDTSATAGSGRASTYGLSKRAAEAYILQQCSPERSNKLSAVCLRPHVVFGPGDPLATEDMLFSPVPPPAIGSSSRVLTPIYVKNLADLAAHLCTRAHVVGVLNVGDAHQSFKSYRKLLLSCRPPKRTSGEAMEKAFLWLAESCTPSVLPLWLAACIAAVAYALDMLTLGTRNWKLLKLTRAALYYIEGANFQYGRDGYSLAGFVPKYGFPDGVQLDLASFAKMKISGEKLSKQDTFDQQKGIPHLFSEWKLQGLTLRNRVIKEATFEACCDSEGVPTMELLKFHGAVAKGGAALTTVAYASVSPDGRSFETQLLMGHASAPRLRELTKIVHGHGAKAMVQLTHAGSFADREVIGQQQISASGVFNPAGVDFAREMSLHDIERVGDDFAKAASLALECGFDAIQVHCGHGYLLSQFLSPFSNVRLDRYGCLSVSDRVRFPMEVLGKVRAAVGPCVPIVVKFNLSDGFDGGITLEQAIAFAQCMDRSGLVDLLIPSGGWVSRNGFFMLRGDVPLANMVKAQKKSLFKRIALRLLGPCLVPHIEWTPSFFETDAMALLAHMRTTPVCLLGGINSLGAMERAMANGFAAVALARALLREPDFLLRLQVNIGKESHKESLCSHCNECIVVSAMAENPLRCVEMW